MIARPIRLLVSDIDGTLVTADKVLTPRAISAVQSLAAADVGFTVISSRPPRGIAPIVKRLNVRLPFAAFNGGCLVGQAMEVIEAHRLTRVAAERALAVLSVAGVGVWVFAGGEWLLGDAGAPRVAHERRTVGFDPVTVETFQPVLDRVDKIVGVSDDPAKLEAVERELARELGHIANVERSQAYYLDITHRQANKGDGVRALAAMAGVDLAETAVIGDMTNDVAMFETAALSIAMGQSPPAVQARAGAVTLSNAQDGFAAAVETIVLPRARGAG
jgi:Cof subfamily protein (haloacid dehalogenase superfamily)